MEILAREIGNVVQVGAMILQRNVMEDRLLYQGLRSKFVKIREGAKFHGVLLILIAAATGEHAVIRVEKITAVMEIVQQDRMEIATREEQAE